MVADFGGGSVENQNVLDIEKRKKRYLKRYRKNVACIARLEAKLDILDAKIKTIRSPNLSGMPRGGATITMEDLVADKVDLEDRIKRLKAKSRGLKNSVCEEIDTLEDARYCDVLEAYFIDCLSMSEIADELGYTERHVYTLYKEAISLLSVSSQ
jgi:predicted DNA-binding protein YlxM (UPF0122 family)